MGATVASFGVDERRARLARRHHLTPASGGADPVTVAGDLLGFHGTDPATIFLSARARCPGLTPESLGVALYDDRSLVRMLAMRRTMFVVPVELIGVLQAACTDAVAARERKKLVGWLEAAGVAKDVPAWVRRVERDTLRAIEARGSAVTADLDADVPALRRRLVANPGKRSETSMGLAGRILLLLAADGHIVRGRPGGTWVSTRYTWVPTATWLGAAPEVPPVHEARAELVRRWLRAYGPASLADLRWWTGWTLGEAKPAIAATGAIEADLDGEPGLVLADDVEPVLTGPSEPWAALLPALDPTVMGWKERDWYLGPHRERLFDTNGNAGPTVWWDGRVVGGWAHRPDGTVALRSLEPIGTEGETAVEAEAAVVEAWLGERRFVPRFRTPLEKELTA